MIEVEEHRDEAVVSKNVRIVEEISLKKTAEQREQTISDSVRKTEVEIEDERTATSRSGEVESLLREQVLQQGGFSRPFSFVAPIATLVTALVNGITASVLRQPGSLLVNERLLYSTH